jgi:hypothetical protein
MSPFEMLVLAGAAMAAGVVNAIAGGGTLLTFPALLLTGTTPIRANATSTVALLLGIAGSFYGYRRQIGEQSAWMRRFLPVSLAGGLLGGILLTRSGDALFAWLVPFLILFATLVFTLQGAFRRFAGVEGGDAHLDPGRPHALALALGFQFLVAVYGGYFGAGIGILMLASLGVLGWTDIHAMNAVKTVLGAVINLVAAAYFIFMGLIDWPKAGVMTAGALLGYYLGSHGSQYLPPVVVRRAVVLIGFVIAGVLFARKF